MDVSAPPRVQHRIKVRWPRSVAGFSGLILNRRAVQMLVHNIDGRTLPHFTPREKCEGCVRKMRQSIKGYLGCFDTASKIPFIAMYTEHTIGGEPRLDIASGVDLRGLTLRLKKAGEEQTSSVIGELLGPRESSLVIPDPVAVRRILEDMWRLPSGCLGEDEG
ncbi:MAG TPA: hypothetical protein VH092_38385 [Urbifossiella sp.]|nr:hypothetical protein [Urbifossiella sp.]